jgi:hypothetical protein
MAITAISRDWGIDPQIVRVVTTDTLATIIATGYITSQATAIAALNNGAFQWRADDEVLISYAGGQGFFTYDATNLTFAMSAASLIAQVKLTSAQILGMSAAPVLLLAAPGANKMIILNKLSFTYLYGGVAYAAGGAIGLEWANTAALAGPAASTTLAAATFNGYVASNNFELTPDNTDTLANMINQAVYISNATAAFTTGTGTLIANLNYNIVNAA